MVHLEHLEQQCRDYLEALEVNKHRVKVQYNKLVHPRSLVRETWSCCGINRKNPWAQENLTPCGMVKRVLEKGAYELVDYEGMALEEHRNGLYIKKYYA